MSSTLLCRCFFFQAEDGIRDLTVTGVQTCALPIFDRRASFSSARPYKQEVGGSRPSPPLALYLAADRESVGEGKSVDLGGRRIIKKKKKGRIPAAERRRHEHRRSVANALPCHPNSS